MRQTRALVDVQAAVRDALLRHPAITGLRLVGSRAEGRATALSDWDFLVETRDAGRVAADLASLVAPLAPLAAQWDRLAEGATYFLLVLRDGTKVDLVLERAPAREPPWRVGADTLAALDAHVWDWLLWLGGKQLAGNGGLVRDHLSGPMWEHLLRPLGVASPPCSLAGALAAYVRSRGAREAGLGVSVPRALGEVVAARLRRAGVLAP